MIKTLSLAPCVTAIALVAGLIPSDGRERILMVLLPSSASVTRAYLEAGSVNLPLQQILPQVWSLVLPGGGADALEEPRIVAVVGDGVASASECWAIPVRLPETEFLDLSRTELRAPDWERSSGFAETVWIVWRPPPGETPEAPGPPVCWQNWGLLGMRGLPMQDVGDGVWIARGMKPVLLPQRELCAAVRWDGRSPDPGDLVSLAEMGAELRYLSR